jgi:hypothetical protein
MAEQDNTVLLRVQLDVGKTEERLKQLVLDIESTRLAQKALNEARQQGAVTDAEFAAQSVKLQADLKNQRTEQTALSRNLDLYNRAVSDVGDSYKATQAQLSLAQRQYQELAGSASNSTEETQALSRVIDELRGTLKTTDAQQGAFFRNIGRYPTLTDEARAGLEALASEYATLRDAQATAAKQGGPVDEQAVKRIEELKLALTNAELASGQYGNSVVELKRKLADLTTARDLTQDKEALQQLNASILETRGAIQEATGKVDEFGDKIEKNAKKEELATLGDAFGGVTAAIQLSTLAMADQEDAERATAIATTILAQAEAARNLQIGLASVKDAVNIGLLRAKKLLFVENTVATAANTTATVAQATATQGATLAQRALNLAMTLNPIGLIVVAIGALVGAFFAWRGASDSTKKSVADITEKVLRFGTPIGLVVTGLQKLYEKSETVRQVLDPLAKAFDYVAGKVKTYAQEAGEAVGLLDTAAEKSAKASAQLVEATEREIASYQLRARQLELAGAALQQYRSTEREGLVKNLEALKQDNAQQDALHRQELARIDEKIIANDKLTEFEQTLLDERKEREDKYIAAQIKLTEFDQATQEQLAARSKAEADARKKELADAKTDAERRRKQAEQELKEVYATRKLLLENRQQQIARLLELTERGSADEQRLLIEQAKNATAIQLADNSAAQVGVLKKQQEALLAARKEIMANGSAELTKLEKELVQKRAMEVFDITLQGNETALAQVQEATDEETRIKREGINLQLAQQLAAIDKRDSAEKRAAQEALLRAKANKELAALEYEDSLRKLETYLADKKQVLERQYASGELSEKEYQQRLAAQEQVALQARIVLNQDYKRDVTELTKQKVEAQISEEKRLTDLTKQELKKKIDASVAFGAEVGQILADSLQQQGQELESFAAGFILLILDVLEQQAKATLAAAIFSSTVQSYAQPDSVATFGVSGTIRAAILGAAISAAFAVLKGAIRGALTSTSDSKFAQGTVLGGASHAHGGTQLFGRDGHWYGEAEAGEAIINKNSTRLFLPLLSALNVAGGGKALLSGHPYQQPLALPRFALGGISASVVRDSLSGPQVAAIDYDKLAQATAKALRENPPITRISDVKSGLSRSDFTDRMANS